MPAAGPPWPLSSSIVVTLLMTGVGTSQSPADALTGVEKTEHFEIHFRPGSRAEAAVDRVMVVVEGDLARIMHELGLARFPHVIRLYLYDDVADLQKTTGVPSGGHSTTLESHVPCDNDQTRVHELVHVVAEQFPEKDEASRNMFFAEGLANAVLRFVHGVPVDAVAAFYLQRGELPSLAEMTEVEDFYGWLSQRPWLNAYDVAGSFMRYLLDEFGAARVRRYYKGTPAQEAFGRDLASLEKGWHKRLARVVLRPGLKALLLERAGGPTAADENPAERKLDATILGPDRDWHSLGGVVPAAGDPARVEGDGDTQSLWVSGEKSQGDWSVARLGEPVGDALVRCEVQPLGDCFGVQIQLGEACQAMVLRGQGTFVYNEVGGVGHDSHVQLGRAPIEIVLRRRNGRASVWVDGTLTVEAPVSDTPAAVGVGCVGGPARFRKLAVRPLH